MSLSAEVIYAAGVMQPLTPLHTVPEPEYT